MKISSIRLENYKLFEDQIFKFKKITILAGANSSGKSIVLGALAAILQGKDDRLFPFFFPNYGDNVNLGGYKDVVKDRNTKKKFGIDIRYGEQGNSRVYGKFRYSSEGNQILLDRVCIEYPGFEFMLKWINKGTGYKVYGLSDEAAWKEVMNGVSSLMVSLREFMKGSKMEGSAEGDAELSKVISRMSQVGGAWEDVKSRTTDGVLKELRADAMYGRYLATLATLTKSLSDDFLYIGPIRAYPARHYPVQTSSNKIDARGNNAYYMILDWSRHDQKKYSALVSDINFLGMANDLKTMRIKDDLIELSVTPFNHKEDVNLSDVGFGVSQLIPVLIANISLPEGGTLLVNQPEVHLHPSAQAKLANYFVRESKTKNFILETHSEYLINRMRLLVGKKLIDKDDVAIIYIDSGPEGEPKVHNIEISKEGRLINAPQSFLDNNFVDSKELVLGGFDE
jgi:hypothetical protein